MICTAGGVSFDSIEARSRRKRRIVTGFTLLVLIVIAVGAVFLGSTLWHILFGSVND
jgi:UPF0755 protein